jgi:hypothetical protein
MRTLIAAAALLTSLSPGLALAQQAPQLTTYKTISSAACSPDRTVWIDPRTRTYYVRGDALYGKTRPGGYNCLKQVEAAGYRRAAAQ